MTTEFICEIFTEELPTKAITPLARHLANSVAEQLNSIGLKYDSWKAFSTPRRLSVYVTGLETQTQARTVERRGPAVNAGFDAQGNPTKALEGFAKSCGTSVEELSKIETPKGEWFVFQETEAGKETAAILPGIIEQAIKTMPIPKRMRWGNYDIEFVRPIHNILMMLDNAVVPATILGKTSNNITYGHRFHAPHAITLSRASDYENTLLNEGHVIVDSEKRKALIEKQIHKIIEEKLETGSKAYFTDALLDEVNALVEWPVAMMGEFNPDFLSVPKEALITSMQHHQKCFPTLSKEGGLLPNYILISNLSTEDRSHIIHGNNRVMNSRLADANFFYHKDCETPLSAHIDGLKTITYQKQLGSVYDKSQRVKRLATILAKSLNLDSDTVNRAVDLAKADLLTDMVGEFPELQGIMGRYYALYHQEKQEIAEALWEQYLPRFSKDTLPHSKLGQVIALAERFDTIAAIFAINKQPTGDKDPFALRRAALGVVRILVECKLPLNVFTLITESVNNYQKFPHKENEISQFILDRLRSYCLEQDIPADIFNAVLASHPTELDDFFHRALAVKAFKHSESASSLAAANKRVSNILAKNAMGDAEASIHASLLEMPEEKALAEAVAKQQSAIVPLLNNKDYAGVLETLSTLKTTVDSFFDKVMVMCEDPKVRQNRIALLSSLRTLFLKVADIALLQL